jgi:dienelactone hydrolase
MGVTIMTTTHLVHMAHAGGHLRQHPKRSRKRSAKKRAHADVTMHDEIMVEELNAVHGELSRVDSKSSMLLGFAAGGLLLATAVPATGLGGLLIKAGTGLAAASIVPLLVVVRPRLGATGFPHHAVRTIAQIKAELAKVNPVTWRSEQLLALSRIAVRKCKLLRLATALQTLALVVACAGALLVMV